MSKMILGGVVLVAALGLTACGSKSEENNIAVENLEDLNATEDLNMDMNATDLNATADMNATTDMNASGNAAGNETTGNNTGY
jgi:outer membrane murein-binding lipoprotein Lpp